MTTAAQKTAARKPSTLGLNAIGGLSNLLSKTGPATENQGPTQFDMALIDEDLQQPRQENNPGFTEESLAELALSIAERGVKSPISLRKSSVPGRFTLNHGARRFRASKLAGKTHIPGFLDEDYSDADQVVENLQRSELTARELADFIGRKIAEGMKKGAIAKVLGKSNAFISQHVTLLDLPDPIAEAFNAGRCRDVTVVNELVKAYKSEPDRVTEWLEDESMEITRGTVGLLREFLESRNNEPEPGSSDTPSGDLGTDEGPDESPAKSPKVDPSKLKKAIVQVEHHGRPARVLLDRRPSEVGLAWFKYDDDGSVFEASISEAKMVALVEA